MSAERPAASSQGSAAEPSDGSFRVGLLGHGTVGAAFAQLLGERADTSRR